MKTANFLKYEINTREAGRYPLAGDEVFKRHAALAVEIGCGNGEFLAAWAQAQPEWDFIGIELSLESAERIQNRLFKNQLQNVRLIRDDARFVVRELFFDNSICYVVMNFPDPWPKEKHRHHRLIDHDFVWTLSAVLEPKGIFELVTDQEWYARDAQIYFRDSGLFRLDEIEVNPRRKVTTKYERKWRDYKRKSFRLKAVKRRSHEIQRIMENDEMPHVIIQQEIQSEKIFALKGLVKKEKKIVFSVKTVFTDAEDKTYLLRVFTADMDYIQKFYILIARHSEGYIVKIDPSAKPYRTPAVKKAIRDIGKILEG